MKSPGLGGPGLKDGRLVRVEPIWCWWLIAVPPSFGGLPRLGACVFDMGGPWVTPSPVVTSNSPKSRSAPDVAGRDFFKADDKKRTPSRLRTRGSLRVVASARGELTSGRRRGVGGGELPSILSRHVDVAFAVGCSSFNRHASARKKTKSPSRKLRLPTGAEGAFAV
jgi:hypothetical protein